MPSALDPTRLRNAMDRRAISRADLCSRVGVSPGYLSRILSGKVTITSAALVERLSGALDASAADLIGTEGSGVITVPPHLWSAPLLNGGEHRPRVVPAAVDQTFTGREAIGLVRSGTAAFALAFPSALTMADDAEIVTVGSICSGVRHVRLLIHRASPFMKTFAQLGSAPPHALPLEKPRRWSRQPTAAFREDTVVGEYLQRLEAGLPQLEHARRVDLRPSEPWLSTEGEPPHLIVTWDPVASGIVAGSDGQFVDIFDTFGGVLPEVWFPESAEYLLVMARRLATTRELLRAMIRQVLDAVRSFNHHQSRSRIALQNQPVIGHFQTTLTHRLGGEAEARFRQSIVRHLRETPFAFRLRPELVTTEVL